MEERIEEPGSAGGVESLLGSAVMPWKLLVESFGIADLYSEWVIHRLPKGQIKAVMELALNVFEDAQIAKEWLSEPNLATDNQPPISLLGTEEGFSRVRMLLHRIEYGLLA